MKFMFFFYPAIPATMDDREKLRPIAARTDRFQQMLDEIVELSQMAEDLGFSAVTFPEHHLHGEGGEMGSLPVLTQHVLANTKKILAGPIGYVLPGWNPLRLALEMAWLDQITKGRTIAGFARGYQARWLNPMAQHLHGVSALNDAMRPDNDTINREAFQEVFEILKLAWAEKPFRYKGKYYEYPYPYEGGTPWPAASWTRQYGTPGEIDDDGNIQMINVVPKPYQKPHPLLFQAFSQSEGTIRWAAKEGIIPTLLTSDLDDLRAFADLHVEEAAKHGRELALGESLGVFRTVYMADDRAKAREIAGAGQFHRPELRRATGAAVGQHEQRDVRVHPAKLAHRAPERPRLRRIEHREAVVRLGRRAGRHAQHGERGGGENEARHSRFPHFSFGAGRILPSC